MARGLAASLLVFLLLFLPAIAVIQQALFLLAARLLSDTTALVETQLLPTLPLDPVYAGAALRIVGGIQPTGLAVAGWPGWALYHLAPGTFGSPDLVAPGAIASALVEPGATVAAQALGALLATALSLMLVSALAAVLTGAPATRLRNPSLFLSINMARVWLLLGLVHETALDVRELDATGLPFAFAALSPVAAGGQRALLTRQLEQIPEPAVELVTGLAAVLICLGIAIAPILLIRLVRALPRLVRLVHARPRLTAWGSGSVLIRQPRQVWLGLAPTLLGAASAGLPRLVGIVALAGVVVLTPLEVAGSGRIAIATQNFNTAAAQASSAAGSPTIAVAAAEAPRAAVSLAPATPPDASSPPGAVPAAPADIAAAPTVVPTDVPPTPLPAPAPTLARPTSSRGTGGSVVTVSGSNYQYSLAVNGEPTVVRGMGYNPWYATLGPAERRPRYARDFAAMHEIGVNTLEGWFQDQFDEITLDEAHRNGLGVILPFELNQDYDYSDPAVRARFRDQISAWVMRYRDNPAVRMWGPGNEVMHRLIFPTAVQGQRDPARERRADDFAAFYVELIDLIHQLDPDHPVIYRDAEDLYLARIRQALLKDGQRRPWFIYGTNVYTKRLAAVIENWPNQGLDAPLLVSEFSPGGVGPEERPNMLGWYWSTIRAHPERVLGGVVYTWATGGPEDLDRVFGLTDEAGRPVDGSIAALRGLFRPGTVGAGNPSATNGATAPNGMSAPNGTNGS